MHDDSIRRREMLNASDSSCRDAIEAVAGDFLWLLIIARGDGVKNRLGQQDA